jgi:transcriptional regulator with XRE-family HTH domain
MKKRYEDDIVPDSSRRIRMEMARQMREARVGEHLTQQVVAERAGTRKSNISRMESGNYNPTLDFLVKVAESMGKQVSICLDDKS